MGFKKEYEITRHTEEEKNMAAITFDKPSTYEITTASEKIQDVIKALEKKSLSEDFLKECLKVSEKYRKKDE